MRPRTARTIELPLEVIVEGYLFAFETVVGAGFAHEIDEQERRRLERVTESDFLREAAWVVLCAGMRERIVRDLFPDVSDAFLQWRSAKDIVRSRSRCTRRALAVFAHRPKIEAIVAIAEQVALVSFEAVRLAVTRRGVAALEAFPYVGPITKFHLAKNLGLDVAKPDRHLVRLSHAAGFADPAQLCATVAGATGDRVATVDLVFWRYATINPGYQALFGCSARTRKGIRARSSTR